jgi:hypothetical protein
VTVLGSGRRVPAGKGISISETLCASSPLNNADFCTPERAVFLEFWGAADRKTTFSTGC